MSSTPNRASIIYEDHKEHEALCLLKELKEIPASFVLPSNNTIKQLQFIIHAVSIVHELFRRNSQGL